MPRFSKDFCIKCETLQRPASKCLKCGSQNIYNVGSITRFPKHPKPRDYEEVFYSLVRTATYLNSLNHVKRIQTYINEHKFGTKVYGRTYPSKKTFNEMILKVVLKLEKQIKADEEKANSIRTEDIFPMRYFPTFNENVQRFLTVNTNDYNRVQGWAVPIYEGVICGYYKRKGNPFRPLRVSVTKNQNAVFKDKETALAFSQYFAEFFLKEVSSYSDDSRFKPELLLHARKHADNCNKSLNKNFSEYMV